MTALDIVSVILLSAAGCCVIAGGAYIWLSSQLWRDDEHD